MSGPGGENAIVVSGLRKGYGDLPVLADLDLAVPWGELLVLFGSNGAGKTTLLRVLATQARADAGTVTVAGFDVGKQGRSVRRRVGVVGHQGFLYDDLTCRENLAFYGRLFSLSQLDRRVDEALARVGMNDRADQRVRTLSHGMTKRVAIARAVLHGPDLLLLDEPEGGLDPESVGMLRGILEQFVNDGKTVVMTTHNVERGREWAHRTAHLRGGKVVVEHPEAVASGAGSLGGGPGG